MELKELYLNLLTFLNNSYKLDKTRFIIQKDKTKADQYVWLVNAVLTLEKKENQKFKTKEVAPAFAKGLRNIYGSKLVFETFEEVDLALIEKKYNQLVKELSTELKLPKTKLTTKDEFDLIQIENAQPLTKEECDEVNLLLNPVVETPVNPEIVNQGADGTNAPAGANTNSGQNQNQQQQGPPPVNPQMVNQGQNPFMGGGNPFFGFGGQQPNPNMPVMPLQDPRFYPLMSKPKHMPLMKKLVGILALTTTILFLITMIITMTSTIDISNDKYAEALGATNGSGWDGIWGNGAQGAIQFTNSNYFQLLTNFPIGLVTFSVWTIMNLIFFTIPAIFLLNQGFKQPRNAMQKYKSSTAMVVLVLICLVMILVSNWNYLNIDTFKNLWSGLFGNFWTSNQLIPENLVDFNKFWDLVINNYGPKFETASTLTIVSVSFMCALVVMSVMMIVMNPKLDRAKIQRAQMEYQKAVMESMQGRKYEMDPSLFDNDEELTIKEKGKFSIWLQSKKKTDKKDKDEK